MTRASGAAARRERRAAPLRLETGADHVDVFLREQVDPAERVLAAVMFTDIARSRVHLPTIDERAWPELVTAYGDIVGRQAIRYNGRIVQSADGSFVRFSGAYSAVRCALAIRQDLRDLGVDLRAGLHAGQGQPARRGHRRRRRARREPNLWRRRLGPRPHVTSGRRPPHRIMRSLRRCRHLPARRCSGRMAAARGQRMTWAVSGNPPQLAFARGGPSPK